MKSTYNFYAKDWMFIKKWFSKYPVYGNRKLLLNALLPYAYLINIYTHMPDTSHINTIWNPSRLYFFNNNTFLLKNI